jgi:hypothetical protein
LRPKTLIYLIVLALVAGLGVVSFYGNVLGEEDEQPPAAAATAPSSASTAQAIPDEPAAQVEGLNAEQVVPVSLAGLPVTNSIDGEAAMVQTEQLHGKALGEGFDAAWIAQYGAEGQGTRWISRSAAEADAQTLMDRMSERINTVETPFQNFLTTEMAGTAVVSLDGMGQKHYYFRVGRDLYWLAVDPASAETALDELLANAREVAAR